MKKIKSQHIMMLRARKIYEYGGKNERKPYKLGL